MILSDEFLGQDAWSVTKKWVLFFVSLFVFFGALVISTIIVVWLISLLAPTGWQADLESRPGLWVALMAFVGVYLGGAIVMRTIYRRSILQLLNPYGVNMRRDLAIGALYAVVFLVLGEVIAEIVVHDRVEWVYRGQFDKWLVWILPYILAIGIQTSAEELAFRGYMQQYLARLMPWRIVYYLVPASLWASLHIGNLGSSSQTDMAAVFVTFVLGIILADWADRSGSLAGPIAMHFVNNFVLIAIIGYSLQPSDMQLFQIDVSALSDGELAVATLLSAPLMVFLYLFVRPAITRKPCVPTSSPSLAE